MKFYEIDNALQDAIIAADKLVRIKIDIYFDNEVLCINDSDIIEAQFFGLKEVTGGTSARGEISISNEQLVMSNEECAGRKMCRQKSDCFILVG